jgi:hypothetical protein
MGSESKAAVYEEMQKRIIELESVRFFLRISFRKRSIVVRSSPLPRGYFKVSRISTVVLFFRQKVS